MPVMGPTDMREEADKAILEIAYLLITKYHIDILKQETFGICKDDYNQSVEALKTAVRDVFKFDSWNGW